MHLMKFFVFKQNSSLCYLINSILILKTNTVLLHLFSSKTVKRLREMLVYMILLNVQ